MRFSFFRMSSIMAVTALMGVACSGEDKVGDDEKSSGGKTEGVIVTTADASDIAYSSATLNATCSITNGKDVQGVAIFYYGTLNDLDNIKVNGKKVVVDMISENTKSFSKEIRGLKPSTQYYYVAYITIGEKEYSGSAKSFITKDAKENGYELVDLGLSVMWATYNVGATKPEEYGHFFAWGETETKSTYNLSTYKWYNGSSLTNGSSGTLTKYNISSSYGPEDNKTTLDAADDVAHVKWGGSWRMPTKAEQDELRTNCTWTWTTMNGVNGYRVTSNKSGYTDRSIFLPAAGYCEDSSWRGAGSFGFYWSSSLFTDNPYTAWVINFNSSGGNTAVGRDGGRSVRPVCP